NFVGGHLLPDVARTVATGPANLVSTGWSTGCIAEVNEEVLVEFHSAFFGVDISFHHERALLAHVGVGLVVPARKQRGGPVKPTAVAAELQHLWCAVNIAPLNFLSVAEVSASPDLIDESRIAGIADVVHPAVAVEPVREEKVLVVQRNEGVR